MHIIRRVLFASAIWLSAWAGAKADFIVADVVSSFGLAYENPAFVAGVSDGPAVTLNSSRSLSFGGTYTSVYRTEHTGAQRTLSWSTLNTTSPAEGTTFDFEAQSRTLRSDVEIATTFDLTVPTLVSIDFSGTAVGQSVGGAFTTQARLSGGNLAGTRFYQVTSLLGGQNTVHEEMVLEAGRYTVLMLSAATGFQHPLSGVTVNGTTQGTFTISAVPEPSSLALLLFALSSLLGTRKRSHGVVTLL